MFSRLVVPDSLLEEVIAHARREAPLECCGLLAGQAAGGVGAAAARCEIGNAARSATAYETDARDMLYAFRWMRERGYELLAIYHSHPTSDPIPSARDVERNTYGESVVHVIVGLAGAAPTVRAWRLTEAGCRAVELIRAGPAAE
jgi:proteasome lid subunit RPN8/RPN11